MRQVLRRRLEEARKQNGRSAGADGKRTSCSNVSVVPAHEGIRTAERGDESCAWAVRALLAMAARAEKSESCARKADVDRSGQ